jgi:hypothetical protein
MSIRLDLRLNRREDVGMRAGLLLWALCAAAASASLGAQASSATPDLRTVLQRAAAYVDHFRQELSGIVAEETYVQQLIPGERRETRSDLLLVRSGTFPRWLQFRDTFEVDGAPVRDRQDRLTALFLQPGSTAVERAQRIASESSRYNVGPLLRTINVPLMPLVFLESDIQPRLRFSRRSDRDEPNAARDALVPGHFRVGTEVWVIGFEERDRPTIIRDPINRRDVPTQGRFWIEPQSGRVLMSEMRSTHFNVIADITVSYQSDPLVGLLVPIAMHERYEHRIRTRMLRPGGVWRRIEATALYSGFRRFRVETDQHIELPDPQTSPNDASLRQGFWGQERSPF